LALKRIMVGKVLSGMGLTNVQKDRLDVASRVLSVELLHGWTRHSAVRSSQGAEFDHRHALATHFRQSEHVSQVQLEKYRIRPPVSCLEKLWPGPECPDVVVRREDRVVVTVRFHRRPPEHVGGSAIRARTLPRGEC